MENEKNSDNLENKIINSQEDNTNKIIEQQNNNKSESENLSKNENIPNKNTNTSSNINNHIQEALYEEYDSDNSALSNSDISENDIDSITKRTTNNKNMDLETFYRQSRQYFIMTEGGTPIYSRYGDEIKNCSLSATFSAIITKFVAFNGGTNNSEESLNYIKNEYSLIVF